MKIQKNFLQEICIVMIMTMTFMGNYSKAVGAEISTTLQIPLFNQQMDFVKEIVVEREALHQKKLEQERVHQKLLSLGVPSTLKTGQDLLEEKVTHSNDDENNTQPIMDSKNIFQTVMEELKDRYEELYEKSISNRSSIPISNYYYTLLTPEIAEAIPMHLIQAQDFNPSDDPFTTAIKLERLGLIIKDLTPKEAAPKILSPRIYERKRHLMGKCFALAGSHVNRAVKLLIENPEAEMDLDILKDMYQTGGLLYHWASLNMPFQSGGPMNLLTENFYNGLKMILHMYDSLEGATDEKKDNDC